MANIWKHKLDPEVRNEVFGVRALSVGLQEGEMVAWVEVAELGDTHTIDIEIAGTGWKAPNGRFFGTVQQGAYVWHAYVRGEK